MRRLEVSTLSSDNSIFVSNTNYYLLCLSISSSSLSQVKIENHSSMGRGMSLQLDWCCIWGKYDSEAALERQRGMRLGQIGCYNSLVRGDHYHKLMLRTIHRLLEKRKLLALVIIEESTLVSVCRAGQEIGDHQIYSSFQIWRKSIGGDSLCQKQSESCRVWVDLYYFDYDL